MKARKIKQVERLARAEADRVRLLIACEALLHVAEGYPGSMKDMAINLGREAVALTRGEGTL